MKFTGAFLFSISLFFVFSSCDTKYSVTVRNNSSKTVIYTYNDMTDTLNPSLSKEYQVEVYTQAPRDISVPGETVMKIKMEIPSGGEYIFSDVPSLNLEVDNKLKYRIALTAGNYIDDGSGETSLEVPALTSKTACIYTDNPRFTVTPPGYSAIEWKITNGTMYVTVK